MQELYVYGLIQEKPNQQLSQKGLANNLIEYLPVANYIALVSPWQSSNDPEPVPPSRKNLLSHQGVLSEVLSQTSILPFKFGTLMQKDTLVDFCRDASPQLEENFLKIAQKIEVSLKGTWRSIQEIYEEILEENPAIKIQKEALAQQNTPPDQHQLIEIGKKVETALLNKKSSMSEYIYDFLKTQIVDVRFKEYLDDAMFLNAAILIEQEQEPAFEARLQILAQELGERVHFKYTSPFAPYHFINLEMQ